MGYKFISPVSLGVGFYTSDGDGKTYVAARLFANTFNDMPWYDISQVEPCKANVVPFIMKNENKRKQFPGAWFAVKIPIDLFNEYATAPEDERMNIIPLDVVEGIAGPFVHEEDAFARACDAADAIEPAIASEEELEDCPSPECDNRELSFEEEPSLYFHVEEPYETMEKEPVTSQIMQVVQEEKQFFPKLEIVDCYDGNVSICAVVGDELREDPQNADIPRAQAEEALEKYLSNSDPFAGIALARVGEWPVVG